jgi:hypothetical protein
LFNPQTYNSNANGVTELLAALDTPRPNELTAATVTVYASPVVNPEIVTGDEEPVPLMVVPSDVFFAVAT